MVPTLDPGEFVLYEPDASFDVGDVVVARHPSRSLLLVKRVTGVDPVGLVELGSDNEAVGNDSRDFGRIDVDGVVGTVTISLDWPFRMVGSGASGRRGRR